MVVEVVQWQVHLCTDLLAGLECTWAEEGCRGQGTCCLVFLLPGAWWKATCGAWLGGGMLALVLVLA